MLVTFLLQLLICFDCWLRFLTVCLDSVLRNEILLTILSTHVVHVDYFGCCCDLAAIVVFIFLVYLTPWHTRCRMHELRPLGLHTNQNMQANVGTLFESTDLFISKHRFSFDDRPSIHEAQSDACGHQTPNPKEWFESLPINKKEYYSCIDFEGQIAQVVNQNGCLCVDNM